MKRFATVVLTIFWICWPALAQQTGSISGTVTSADGAALPGVTVEASGDVLPLARTAVTEADGDYRFPGLPPGNYELVFTLEGFGTQKRTLKVLLQQDTVVDVTLQLAEVTEELVVTSVAPPIDVTSTELKAAIDDEAITQVPIGQEYRDVVKLIPGVQYTEDATRGPSAGGSGQDNVYKFDGVNVGRPLFGTLSNDASSHDIAQVSIIKGGAKAVDFNRSGGFTIDTISKSGTSSWRGLLSYQIQTEGMTGDRKTESAAEFDRDRDWSIASVGGPVASQRLFFYGSYYRPTTQRTNRSNLYGDVPDSESVRDEFFGKLTFTPTDSFLLNVSHRTSDRENTGEGVASESRAGTASEGSDVTFDISILEGSWVLNDRSFLSFKYTDFTNENFGRPDNLLGFPIAIDGSVALDVNNLDQQGLFGVPQPLEGEDAYNAFIAPLIDRYGFLENGLRTGGGSVGVATTINNQDFFRESYRLGYDVTLGKHDLHFGYQWYRDEEDLSRESNGWGLISVPGGRTLSPNTGLPVFYEVRFQQQSLLAAGGDVVPAINSQFESQSIEVNDTISLDNWTINVGVVASNDELYGEGLRENSSTPSGFELALGHRYKMHEDDFSDMIQPRLGITRSLHGGRGSAYASYARYHPAASSLPRAASWARNLRREIRGYFDAEGNLIDSDPVGSSSGKFFQEGLHPRAIDEYVIGYSKQMTSQWSLKTHARYRYGYNFWEDTNNSARSAYDAPDPISRDDYIPELNDYRFGPDGIGGSSYVIAELDFSYTKYYEASFETEWRSSNARLRASYVWSHYYGNFDQDNTTTDNDADTFIGSSFIADGAGRQLWNFREGNLRGDRRHQLKVYGTYAFDWNGILGLFAVYQSGQPWEAWDVEVYRAYTGSTSDTSRYAEPAGSRTTSDHYQVDLAYTQEFRIGSRYRVELRGDVFNLFDKQTGYNVQNKVNSANFGEPRSFFDPRRFQLAVRFHF